MPQLELPSRYARVLAEIEVKEVSFGAGGLLLFNFDELPAGQVGYSVDRDGESLCGFGDGQWKPHWLAIGYDTGVGDPLTLDISDTGLPVFTSMHGEGGWNLHFIAMTVETLAQCFSEFAASAKGDRTL
jgi:hypothetical protein